ncbi:MAG TPA: sigma-54 dependent transcriptional regulator [Bryobacteraceae bacterium]|nr:sigma-54 dependent transcriptional regulator [Bryobacteraceae bacterium]
MPPKVLCVLNAPASSLMELNAVLADFELLTIAPGWETIANITLEHVDCVLITGSMPSSEAVDLLGQFHALDPRMPVIFWDPEMRATDAVRLIRAGAQHCVGYRDSPGALHDALSNAVEYRRQALRARAQASPREPWREFLVGQSRAMETVAEAVRLIGPRRCTVLISGETGTGKEMVARALHMASPRANQPMVSINCSALPEALLEAELFGHVKGAFTGAISSRIGRFEQANRGTLFLDEIGDMPLELQAKLLRVLQDREIQRLGSPENTRVDVRVIAATNVNLAERVRQGRFREDLFYRLNVVPLEVPPLRKRESDIPLLAEHFVRKICRLEGIPAKQVPLEVLHRLRCCPWPGNVRQLENAVEMAVAMSGEREILHPGDFGLSKPLCPELVPPRASADPMESPEWTDFATAVSQFEQSMLQKALSKTSGNRTAAAELLGMKRTTLIMKLRSFETSGALRAS